MMTPMELLQGENRTPEELQLHRCSCDMDVPGDHQPQRNGSVTVQRNDEDVNVAKGERIDDDGNCKHNIKAEVPDDPDRLYLASDSIVYEVDDTSGLYGKCFTMFIAIDQLNADP